MRAITIPTTAQARVNKGIRLLDKVNPNWFNKIDLDNFDLGDAAHCVLGQVYGNFTRAVATLAGGVRPVPSETPEFKALLKAAKTYEKKYGERGLVDAWGGSFVEQVGGLIIDDDVIDDDFEAVNGSEWAEAHAFDSGAGIGFEELAHIWQHEILKRQIAFKQRRRATAKPKVAKRKVR